uniref:hypothetical protein n=1 Tax=Alistipes shahii TaxID=328814 RepID=UPI003FF07945
FETQSKHKQVIFEKFFRQKRHGKQMVTIYIMGDAKAGRAANGDFGTESPTGSFRAFEVSKQPDLQNADK